MAEAGAAPACRACNPAPGRSGAPRFGHYDPNAGGHSDFRMALTPTPWGAELGPKGQNPFGLGEGSSPVWA